MNYLFDNQANCPDVEVTEIEVSAAVFAYLFP